MSRLLPACLAALLACAAPLFAAGDLTALNEAERAAFRAEVRAYLLDNPEVLIEAIDVLNARRAAEAEEADRLLVAANMKEIAEYPGAWAGGNLAGDVTLVEFLDYRCGWCRRAFPEIEDLVESDGNIRFVIRELPVQGDESILAARFALAVRAVAGDDAYKRLHDDLMTFTGPFTEASLSRIAERNQIDPAPALARLDDPEITRILQDTADLAGRLRIEGTPAFVLDDRLLRGYAPLPQMRALVDEARRD